MISLPVLPNDPNDASLASLFPDAVVVYRYEKDIGYIRVEEADELKVGRGYWILFNNPQKYILSGKLIHSYIQTVSEDGWDMIGGCTNPAHASSNM